MRDMDIPKYVQEHMQQLRKDRKAALRECGRLGEKLHTSRLEIEALRAKVNDLERKTSADAYSS